MKQRRHLADTECFSFLAKSTRISYDKEEGKKKFVLKPGKYSITGH